MGEFVSVTKAAHIVGISIDQMHQQINDGVLSTARGMIHLDDLRQCYPNIKIDGVDMVAWVNKIKDGSLSQGSDKPPNEMNRSELVAQLQKARLETAYQRNRVKKHEQILVSLRQSLLHLKEHSTEPNQLQSLISWVNRQL